MPTGRRLLLLLALWPRVACPQSPAPGTAVPYWMQVENGLPSVRIVEAVLLFRRSVRPAAPPFDGELEAVVADSGARMWLRARLGWLMMDPEVKPTGKRWSIALAGLRAGTPTDSADAVLSAVVADGVVLHREEYLLARRPLAGMAPDDWVVARIRENDAGGEIREPTRAAPKSPKIDSLLIRLAVGKIAAAESVRQIFARNGLVPLEMTPGIFEAELTRNRAGIGCGSSHGCIRAIILGNDSLASVLLLGNALTGDDKDALQQATRVAGAAAEVVVDVLSVTMGDLASMGCCGSSKYLRRVDNRAGGTRGRVWKQLVTLATQLDSTQVPAAARTPP